MTAKTAESAALYQEYKMLRDETAKVKKIRRSMEILHTETPERTRQKSGGVEL
ncbi:hypothetical protein GCM10023142_20410 [Anaerocolumna aminovalerica]